jgi:hypothetical protein
MRLVIAVDPAELHTDVAAMGNVVHIRKMSQQATEDILQAAGEGGSVDLIVSDANRDPESGLCATV